MSNESRSVLINVGVTPAFMYDPRDIEGRVRYDLFFFPFFYIEIIIKMKDRDLQNLHLVVDFGIDAALDFHTAKSRIVGAD